VAMSSAIRVLSAPVSTRKWYGPAPLMKTMVVSRLSVSLAERTAPEPAYFPGSVAAAFLVVRSGGDSTTGAVTARASEGRVAAIVRSPWATNRRRDQSADAPSVPDGAVHRTEVMGSP